MPCKYEHQKAEKIGGRTSYFNCCKCHALLGFGIVKSAQFIGKDKGTVAAGIKAAGIKRYKPDGESWQVSAAIMRRKEKAWQDAWMSEYDFQFPDWMSIATEYVNKKRNRDYDKKRYIESGKGSVFRLKKTIRRRVYNSIKRSTNAKPRITSRTTEMLGCSIEEMKVHLEKQFKHGMTWENHGTHWHIDHIVPLSKFDFTNSIQAALATHYTNLQPMWAHENLSKSDRITQTHQLQFL